MSPEPYPFPDEPLGRVPRSCARRRESDPLGQVTLPSGDVVRLAVRFDDVQAVLTDPRFSRDLNEPSRPRLQPGADMSEDRDTLINLDPPRHTRVRRILGSAFSIRSIERWRPRIREIAQELVDGMRAAGPGVDLVAAVAAPLPIRVISEILGVSDGDLDRFRHWSSVAMSIGPDLADERARGREEFFAYLRFLIEQHRREPGTDLLDAMIAGSAEGDRLSEDELCDTARSLLLAGYETTMTTIGRGVFSLLRNSEQYRELVANPRLLSGAVEEILRYDFPADVGFLRVATEDVQLPSGVIRRGEGVMPVISSANNDAARFPDADRFDIHRAGNAHMSFGKGTHYCIGGHLARVQIQEAFDVLIRNFPDLRLTVPEDQVVWNPSMVTHAIKELPVAWSPAVPRTATDVDVPRLYRRDEVARIAQDLPVVERIERWCREFLAGPHPELGRGGSVCPYITRAMNISSVSFAVVRTRDRPADDIDRVIATFRDILLQMEPVSGPEALLKAIMVILPDVSAAEASTVVDGTHRRVKSQFVESGLMIGKFHPTSEQGGLHNPGFRPLRSPVPLLAIRYMVDSDLPFLNRVDDPVPDRIRFLEAYEQRFEGADDSRWSRRGRVALDEIREREDSGQ